MWLISRTLCWQTNLPDFQGQEKIVIRRYSDFVWLHDHLFEKYKGIFIPPLPEKSTVGNNTQNLLSTGLKLLSLNIKVCLTAVLFAEKFRFSAEFIEMRCRALDVFINCIASHHELQKSEDLRIFLQADEQVNYLIFYILSRKTFLVWFSSIMEFYPGHSVMLCL